MNVKCCSCWETLFRTAKPGNDAFLHQDHLLVEHGLAHLPFDASDVVPTAEASTDELIDLDRHPGVLTTGLDQCFVDSCTAGFGMRGWRFVSNPEEMVPVGSERSAQAVLVAAVGYVEERRCYGGEKVNVSVAKQLASMCIKAGK